MRGHGTVLLCEDDAPVRELIARTLREVGYTVLDAASGGRGLALAAAPGTRVDLLITDVVMPDISGCDVVTRLREARPGLPAILISGYSPETLDRFMLAQDRCGFLAKPFSREQLLTRADALLAGR